MAEKTVFVMTSPSEKLWFNFNDLNKLTENKKKEYGVHYALAYFVVNQIQITDADFNNIKIKLQKFYDEVDKTKKKVSEELTL